MFPVNEACHIFNITFCYIKYIIPATLPGADKQNEKDVMRRWQKYLPAFFPPPVYNPLIMLIRMDPEYMHSPTRTQSLNSIPETQLKCTVIIECVGVCETDESAESENYTHGRVREFVKSGSTALSHIIITLINVMNSLIKLFFFLHRNT